MIGWIYSQDHEFTFKGAFLTAIGITMMLAGILALAIYLLVVRVDAEVRAEFTASKFTFITDRDIRLNSIKFQSLQINDFSNITLYPLPVEDDPRFESVESVSEMVVTPKKSERYASVYVKNVNDEHCGQLVLPTITFPKGSEGQLYEYFLSVTSFMKKLEEKPCGKLDGFIIHKGSTITLEANPDNKGEFSILLKKESSEIPFSPVLVSFEDAFQLSADLSQIKLGNTKFSTEEADLKMILDEDEDPYITITGQPNRLELRLSTFPKESFSIFSDANMPIVTPKMFDLCG